MLLNRTVLPLVILLVVPVVILFFDTLTLLAISPLRSSTFSLHSALPAVFIHAFALHFVIQYPNRERDPILNSSEISRDYK